MSDLPSYIPGLKISEWLKNAKQEIDPLDAELIVPWAMHEVPDRTYVLKYPDHVLSGVFLERADWAKEERKNGRPLAQIIHAKEFYGRVFHVSEDVLIPRPETETLIDLVKELSPKTILDVGTGSGCIAVTLGLELPDAKIAAIDNSEWALLDARHNAFGVAHEAGFRLRKLQDFRARFSFVKSNLLAKYSGPAPDVVVANLPYVDETWNWLDKKTLSYEPPEALYAKDGGLYVIKRLLKQIKERGWKSALVLEADPCQHERLIDFAGKLGFSHQKTAGFGVVLRLN